VKRDHSSQARKRSFVSGKLISITEGSELWFSLFAHVLAKNQGKYPYFKLYLKNIILLLPIEHTLLDQGSGKNRIDYAKRNLPKKVDWGRIDVLRDELIEEYHDTFPKRSQLGMIYKYGLEDIAYKVDPLNEAYIKGLKVPMEAKEQALSILKLPAIGKK